MLVRNKLFKRLWVGGSILLVLLLVARLVLEGFFQYHKNSLLSTIQNEIYTHINGSVEIEGMHLTFFQDFPRFSLKFQNVVIRDSLWNRHHYELFKGDIYASLSYASLLNNKPIIHKITLANAHGFIFVDRNNYSNLSIFDKLKQQQHKHFSTYPIIALENNDWVFEDSTRRKRFHLDIRQLEVVSTHSDSVWHFKTKEDLVFKDLSFKIDRGSFVKNKRLRSKLLFTYSPSIKTLFIPHQKVKLDNENIILRAIFDFQQAPFNYFLKLSSDAISYHQASSMLTPYIQKSLVAVNIKAPVNIVALLQGKIKYKDRPTIRIDMQVKNNTLLTHGGDIKACYFKAIYFEKHYQDTNQHKLKAYIYVPKFNGLYESIPLAADSLLIKNFRQPELSGYLRTSFDLDRLNESIGNNTIHINSGRITTDVFFKMGLSMASTEPPMFEGTIAIKDFGFIYKPRNIIISQSRISLQFHEQDVFVNNASLKLNNKSELSVKGSVKNFINLYYKDPEKIVFDWYLQSNMINLDDLQGLFAHRKKTKAARRINSKNLVNQVSQQLDEVLEKSNVKIQTSVAQLVYKKFLATDISATILMSQNGIAIEHAMVKSADGTLQWNANIDQRGTVNNIELFADLSQVNISKFFYSFNDFEQTAISSKNIKGILNAKLETQLKITDDGEVIPGSVWGNAKFSLTDGEFNQFEPFKKIGKIMFKSRKLDQVSFKPIKSRLDFLGDKIKINPLYIESSAFVMRLEGIYGMNHSTNIWLDIPLSNKLQDSSVLNNQLRFEKNMKGIVLRLQAVDDSSGNVQIKFRSRTDTLQQF